MPLSLCLVLAVSQTDAKVVKKVEKKVAKKEDKSEKKKAKKKSKGSESESESDLGSDAAEEGSDADVNEVDTSLILTTSRRRGRAPVSYKDMIGDSEDEDEDD